jgi:CheY-like chemotaxis protein
VTTATNGAEALTLLRRPELLRPCVILLDLMMPVMNGQEFYAEQQRDPALARIPIVVISADGNIALKAAAFGGEFLPKPVRLETVLGVLGRLCN